MPALRGTGGDFELRVRNLTAIDESVRAMPLLIGHLLGGVRASWQHFHRPRKIPQTEFGMTMKPHASTPRGGGINDHYFARLSNVLAKYVRVDSTRTTVTHPTVLPAINILRYCQYCTISDAPNIRSPWQMINSGGLSRSH